MYLQRNFFLKFAELGIAKIIILFVYFKIDAYFSYIKKNSIYPYSPKKVQFGCLIILEYLKFRPKKAHTKRTSPKYQSIRTNQHGRKITVTKGSIPRSKKDSLSCL